MPVLKKNLSSNSRNAPERKGWKSRIQSPGNRRAEVERATQSPYGFLDNEGVRSGGVEDVSVSHIARSTSGVPRRGIERLKLGRTPKEAKVIGRVPSRKR